MARIGRWMALAASGLVALLVASSGSGCGDDDPLAVTFQGNVANVVRASGPAGTATPTRTATPSPTPTPTSGSIVFAPRDALQLVSSFLVSRAIAQLECSDDVEDVIACGLTVEFREGGEEGSDQAFLVQNCSGVDVETCEFSARVTIAGGVPDTDDDEFAFLAFAQDTDGDGTIDFDDQNGNGRWDFFTEFATEPGAVPDDETAEDMQPTCNGDVFTLVDVDIDFPEGTFSAAQVRKDVDACGPTPGPTGSATATRTRTVTGTPPTATPTRTGTPPTPTVTGTVATPTPSPTGTGVVTNTPTPTPSVTPTPTPCLEAGAGCTIDGTPCCSGICDVLITNTCPF